MHRWKTTNMLDRIGWKRHWGKAKLVSSDVLVYLNFIYLTLELEQNICGEKYLTFKYFRKISTTITRIISNTKSIKIFFF